MKFSPLLFKVTIPSKSQRLLGPILDRYWILLVLAFTHRPVPNRDSPQHQNQSFLFYQPYHITTTHALLWIRSHERYLSRNSILPIRIVEGVLVLYWTTGKGVYRRTAHSSRRATPKSPFLSPPKTVPDSTQPSATATHEKDENQSLVFLVYLGGQAQSQIVSTIRF